MNFCILFSRKKVNFDINYNLNINVIAKNVGVWVKILNLFLEYFIFFNMSINTLTKKKKIISSKDHLTNYNIVNVCKQTIVNGDEDSKKFNEADLSG